MDEMNATLTQVCQYLDEDEFAYGVRSDGQTVATGFVGDHAVFPMTVGLHRDEALLGVFVRIPLVAPEARRGEMADAINRANYGLSLGCFEMNPSDGTIGFRIVMPLEDGSLTRDQFRHLFYSAMASADDYTRAFARLLFGDDMSAAEVIAEIEMNTPSKDEADDEDD